MKILLIIIFGILLSLQAKGLSFSNKNTQKKQNALTKYSKSNMILKANQAYKKGNETDAMIYYEMLLSSGYNNKKRKNNLCYLYGKRGAWFEAKEIIDKERYQGKLLYAYAYGAVENNQENYYQNLLPYIMIDRSGLLMLLTAYYFEKKNYFKKASSFYKMAYNKNPSNLYIMYAYARNIDSQKKYKHALLLYKKILRKTDISNLLHKTTLLRISQIEGIL